jgi:hypothetical protein
MRIATSSEELLWNVSSLAMLNTKQTREHVLELDVNLIPRAARQPEETTTSNLLRQLGHLGQNLGVLAIQHTRSLEGGYKTTPKAKAKSTVRVPSGADLELSIEISPGKWLNLLLQAKALKPSGKYSAWKPAQNLNLIRWARGHNLVPGMLLYNDVVPPFVKRKQPRTPADYVCGAFGACAQVGRTQAGLYSYEANEWWLRGPAQTPGGISLCLDTKQMRSAAVPVLSMSKRHFQLEHLLHISEHHKPIDSRGTTLSDLTSATPSPWALGLLRTRDAVKVADSDQDRDDDQDRVAPDAPRTLEAPARASAVIPFGSAEGNSHVS